ncbi:hypothetical protein HYFRA_00001083 [Hymenoscyphus fraxineus]|uniref:Glucose-methanol-choline oxidoreductase N-terminal domain-containing protein n=1 Tax=Hymenoscyphus fraxineus TaxID=746836 RepID=A0A9N9KUN5_9HELO|nr:hypothetical protein HYFRA_00001083 [Hymenoscyphus fraxineus]
MSRSSGFSSTLQILSLFSFSAALPHRPQFREADFASAVNQTYDYIIVGGGLAGLVVANRLTEQKDKTVLVVENGYLNDQPIATVPYYVNVLNPDNLYPIISAPEAYMNNLTFPVPVGNVVGGGSIVNGMFFDRGSNADYDAWEELGNEGWGWSGLERYFKKSTHFTPPSEAATKEFGLTYDASAYGNGPVQTHLTSYQYPDIKTIFNSYRAEGIPMPIEGFADPVGAYWCPSDIDNRTATRSSSRAAYYDAAANRTNLRLLIGTRVNQILIENDNGKLIAKGVQMVSRANNAVATAYARNEVILAAGAVFTPQILMLSGIGPKDILIAANITVKQDTPAVGSNFQDHTPLAMSFNLTNTTFPDPSSLSTNTTFNAESAAQYARDRSGPYSVARGSAASFLTFKTYSKNYKNITARITQQDATRYLPERYSKNKALLSGFRKQREILVNQFLGDAAAIGEGTIQSGGHCVVALQKPLSRGTITLNTTHPESAPVVSWNSLMNPIDREVLCEMVRWNRVHWARKELSMFSPVENQPGAQYTTNEEIISESVRSGVLTPTFAHMSGGCSMMPRELGGCVSDKLLVYGVERLSVVDASILPLIPATHLQATMYAVAEKAADIIKGR